MADQDDDLEPGSADEPADAAPTPAAQPAPLNPVVQNYLNNQKQLQDAQAESRRNEMLTGIARAGASLSAGLSHSNQQVNEAPFQAMAASDQAPVQNVLNTQKSQATDLANQKAVIDVQKESADTDPTSPQSRAKQKMISSLYPGKFDEETLSSMSAKDIGDSVLKPLELDEKIKEHSEEMKQRVLDRKTAADDKADRKVTDDQARANKDVTSLLESARGNPAAAQAERDIYAAQKAKTLANMYGDPNKLSPAQVQLLAGEIAKIAQGGAPTMHELEGLTPQTLQTKFAGIVQKLTNSPSPANAAEFVKQYQDYADGVTKDAQKVIEDKYGRVIESNRKRLGEDNYGTLKHQYLERFKNESDSVDQDHATRAGNILAQRQKARSAQSTIDQATPNFGTPPPPTAPNGVPSSLAAPGYAAGGTIAGTPKVPFNSPVNDTQTIKASPGEEVLPLSVTRSHAPALSAYLHMRSKGYK